MYAFRFDWQLNFLIFSRISLCLKMQAPSFSLLLCRHFTGERAQGTFQKNWTPHSQDIQKISNSLTTLNGITCVTSVWNSSNSQEMAVGMGLTLKSPAWNQQLVQGSAGDILRENKVVLLGRQLESHQIEPMYRVTLGLWWLKPQEPLDFYNDFCLKTVNVVHCESAKCFS